LILRFVIMVSLVFAVLSHASASAFSDDTYSKQNKSQITFNYEKCPSHKNGTPLNQLTVEQFCALQCDLTQQKQAKINHFWQPLLIVGIDNLFTAKPFKNHTKEVKKRPPKA